MLISSSRQEAGIWTSPSTAEPRPTRVTSTVLLRVQGTFSATLGSVAPPTNVAAQLTLRALDLASPSKGHGASSTGACGQETVNRPFLSVRPTAQPLGRKPSTPGTPT